jgi:tripartite-type tricarboxylate transporter receptor subunit TctC
MIADRYRRNTCAAFLIAFAMMMANGSAIAQSPRQSAPDKPLTLIAGMPPGGSVDAYARLVQRHLGRFFSGSPTIIVQDKPGAGSLLAVLAVANSTPADGLVMGTYSSSLIPEAISQPDRFKVDFLRLSAISVRITVSVIFGAKLEFITSGIWPRGTRSFSARLQPARPAISTSPY